ncbi:MAG: tetratricopeptide repeat protein [Lewinellaceae bacterium]|nr:tetratricopeptide repeat protein [Lewinellaceae bacterium]
MTRTTLRKITYFGLLAVLIASVFWMRNTGLISLYGMLGLGLGLLVLGRIINYPLRHFFKGLRAFRRQQFQESEALFRQFLQDLERRPWIRHLNNWNYGLYTHDLETMAWNNLGAVATHEGRFPEAESCLQKSLLLDSKYPKPYYNLAVLAIRQAQPEKAQHYFDKARELGFSNDSFDQFMTKVQTAYAEVNSGLD